MTPWQTTRTYCFVVFLQASSAADNTELMQQELELLEGDPLEEEGDPSDCLLNPDDTMGDESDAAPLGADVGFALSAFDAQLPAEPLGKKVTFSALLGLPGPSRVAWKGQTYRFLQHPAVSWCLDDAEEAHVIWEACSCIATSHAGLGSACYCGEKWPPEWCSSLP